MDFVLWVFVIERIFFHRECYFSIQPILENVLFFYPHGKESKGKRQTIFRTSLHFFGGTFDEEELPDDYTLPEKVHYDNNRKRYQDIVSWENIISHTKSRIFILVNEVTSVRRLHLQSDLSKRR